ncbi:hypothetical protein ACQKP0_24400 [Heyndrickxia sp. NPDC080065]|uniref:hypothetical protein n=1 Tax=Heyndrickxia sp. NPDC080065 TaxID=3390568 RepID=UPI003CFF8C2E
MSTEQTIARNEINQDPEADLFIHNFSVYKKVKNIKEDIDLSDYSSIGKINSVFSGKGYLEENMSTKLPVNTEIFRAKADSQVVIAKTSEGYILYQSIPEG